MFLSLAASGSGTANFFGFALPYYRQVEALG
jgi:hypothetical protein